MSMISEHIVYEYFIFQQNERSNKIWLFYIITDNFLGFKKKKLNSILIDNIWLSWSVLGEKK